MITRRTLGTALAAYLVVPALAFGAGGDAIASAPQLPLGKTQVVGKTGFDFWKVGLHTGDEFVADFGSTDGEQIELSLLKPDVTDYTRDRASRVAEGYTTGKSQLAHVADVAGAYTLMALDSSCSYTSARCTDGVGYELTGYVKRYTRTTIRYVGPRPLRRGQSWQLHGRVIGGVKSGKVTIEWSSYSSSDDDDWKRYRTLRVSRDGSFVWRARTAREPGDEYVRAVYQGDAGHRISVSNAVYLKWR